MLAKIKSSSESFPLPNKIMKGVRIGENSAIGLGSVIRKSVPPDVVAIGNPQQIVKSLSPQNQSMENHNQDKQWEKPLTHYVDTT